MLHVQGVRLDASSAGALHESLQALRQHEDQELLEIMQLLVTKPMQVGLPALLGSLGCGAPHSLLTPPGIASQPLAST